MDEIFPKQLRTVLKKDLKKFKYYMLDQDYEQFKDYDEEAFFSLYIISILDNPFALKKVKKICIAGGIDGKIFNSFMYTSMKYCDKLDRGIWSWYEIDTLDIQFEDIKGTTLTYTIL